MEIKETKRAARAPSCSESAALLSFSTRPQNLLARSLVRHQRNVISIRSRAYSWPEYMYACRRATFIYNCIPGYKCTRPSLINLINAKRRNDALAELFVFQHSRHSCFSHCQFQFATRLSLEEHAPHETDLSSCTQEVSTRQQCLLRMEIV